MQRILVGLDASPRAAGVLEVAVRLATGLGAKLVLFRGVGIPIEVPSEAYSVTPDSLENILESSAQKHLESLAANIAPGIVEKVRVMAGTPWRSVCQAAKEEKADLIVIGSHGYSGLDRVLGTTASRVVDHAETSVMVVRAAERLA